MAETIEKALRVLDGLEIKVVCRGCRIVKIPAQSIKLQERNGIVTVHEIMADITEE